MNKLDKDYQALLQDILDNGVTKQDRTGTGTISVFGRQIRHNMKDGFPLLTTKKMPFKTIVTELLWFLRGDTNIKYLVDNNCHIWDGDAYKNYEKEWMKENPPFAGPYTDPCLTMEEFINKIKTNDEFAKKWGELGPIYGKQWRSWVNYQLQDYTMETGLNTVRTVKSTTDQIQNLINDLKTNPDSRRLMVNAWNVGELDQMILPPCHYGFQVYTRELSLDERMDLMVKKHKMILEGGDDTLPTRAISLMWNQRSVDTFLGLPFNIASYGLLLEIIAEIVNMVPDQLIGNLGDVHLYSNHVEQAKEQIGTELTFEEKIQWVMRNTDVELENLAITEAAASLSKQTREPYPLPKLRINTEFWNPGTEDGCGMGPGTYTSDINALISGFQVNDFQIEDYQSHPTIKAPLSN